MISHLNKSNKPIMIDISNKKKSLRIARAIGTVKFSKKTFIKISSLKTKKGEILNTAINAGILGAKNTSQLIPLCHNILIENIEINIVRSNSNNSLIITCIVKTTGKTGVEMEALTGVSIACLTIYDMCKSIDKKILIKDIKIIEKSGGKSDFLIV